MAWPQVSNIANTGLGIKGGLPNIIAWGTDGIITGSIVKTVRENRMLEEVRIENGSGITCEEILLYDGTEVDVTIMDDRNITSWPDVGTTVSILSPIESGTSLTVAATFQLVNNNYQVARKAEGERTFHGKHYLLITPGTMS